MAYVIAQLSDIHIGGPHRRSGERFSEALDEINAVTLAPDLVLITGDLTHNGTTVEWSEFLERLDVLDVAWEAIAGNHDRGIAELAGHRVVEPGPQGIVSHLIPVGSAAKRSLIEPHAPEFVDWARGVQGSRDSLFT